VHLEAVPWLRLQSNRCRHPAKFMREKLSIYPDGVSWIELEQALLFVKGISSAG